MTSSIQPQVWVDRPSEALLFYEIAVGATVLRCVGEGDDIVAQLEVGSDASGLNESLLWPTGLRLNHARLALKAAGVGFEPTNDPDGHCRFSRPRLFGSVMPLVGR